MQIHKRNGSDLAPGQYEGSGILGGSGFEALGTGNSYNLGVA